MKIYNACPLEENKLRIVEPSEVIVAKKGVLLTDILHENLGIAIYDKSNNRVAISVIEAYDGGAINSSNVVNTLLRRLNINGNTENLTAYLAGECVSFPRRGIASGQIIKELEKREISHCLELGDCYPAYGRILEIDASKGQVAVYRITDSEEMAKYQ
jgi:hypothetical protein